MIYSRKMMKILKILVEEVMMGTCFSQGIIIPTKVNE